MTNNRISICRYFAVCRPTSKPLTVNRVKKLLVVTALLAVVLLAIKLLVILFHSRWVSDLIDLTEWVAMSLVMCVLYVKIGLELFKRGQRRKKKIGVVTHAAWSTSGQGGSSNQEPSQFALASTTTTTMTKLSMMGPEAEAKSERTDRRAPKVPTKNKGGQMTKTGMMLMLVTFIFIACWTPYWLIVFGVNVPQDPVFLDIFIVNSFVNFPIYCSLSNSFRTRILSIVTCGKLK